MRGTVLVVASGSLARDTAVQLGDGMGRDGVGRDGTSSLHPASFLQLPVRVWPEIPAQRRAHACPCSPRERDFMSPGVTGLSRGVLPQGCSLASSPPAPVSPVRTAPLEPTCSQPMTSMGSWGPDNAGLVSS